jgi:hypothetical protein
MAIPRQRILRSAVASVGNVFSVVQIPTGLFASDNQALIVRSIMAEFASSWDGVADAEIKVALSRRTKVAFPNPALTDPDIIWLAGLSFNILTAVGVATFPRQLFQDFPEDRLDQIVVDDPLFLLHSAVGVGAANPNAFSIRITTEALQVSQLDRLTLISLAQD